MVKEEASTLLELTFRKSSPFRTLLRIFKPEKKNIIISLSVLTIKHSPALFLPIIIGNVINAVISHKPGTTGTILYNTLFITALLLQNIFTQTLFIKYLSKANRSVEHNLRFALVKRMQELSMSFHNSFESGRLQTKVLRDAESVEILSRQLANVVFTGILNVIFALVATLLYNWIVALFFIVTVPLAIIITSAFRKKMAVTNSEYRSQLETMSARVNEMVQMIPITRAHGVEETEISQMRKHLQKVKEKGMRLDILNAVFGASSWVSFQLFQFLCLLVTAFMAYDGRIAVGSVVMFQGFFAMIINSVNMMITIFPEITRGLDSINSLGEILECPDVELNEGRMKVEKVQGNFRFEKVSFGYDFGNHALSDFSVNIRAGECIAVIGESGSGKSTLMNLIIGYRRPDSGSIWLDDTNMQEIDLRTYRRFLAVVPQNIVLFSGTVRENILYGLEHQKITEHRLNDIIRLAKLEELVNALPQGLDTLIGEHGDKLSGGQKQRIAIARALIRDPKVIIFDEATSALDVESEQFIQESIDGMIKGRTTFIVAHRLSTIRKADRIVILNKGKIVETGSPSELLKKGGIYAHMVDMQTVR